MDRSAQSGAVRDAGIDLLKTAAIFGVIIIHMCSAGYNNPIPSFNWLSSVFWGSIVRASVPIFFMCSGALLLSPDRELSLKKLFTGNLLRIVLAMFVWALAYKIYDLLSAGAFSLPALYQALKEVLLFKHEFHLYYLHILILVYLFLPITRVFIKNATQKELSYALAVWFLLGIIYPTVKPFWPFNLLYGIPAQWAMNMTYSAIGYGILGYCFTRSPVPLKRSALLCGVGFLSTFGLTVIMSTKNGSLYQNFLEGMSVCVALLAMGLFGLCYDLGARIKGKASAAVTKISKASFCIYLVHVFILRLFNSLNISVNSFPCLISIPVLSCVNLALSYCCYYILSKIPFVNKWLI